jgi:hypothetical protein
MTPTQILHIVYLCVIAAILLLGGVAMIWWHADAVKIGEEKCHAATQKAVEEQYQADARASQDTIESLASEKARLEALLNSRPPAVIRKCGSVLRVERPVPAGGNPPATQPAEPADRTHDRNLPEGGGSGDVGPGVRAIAAAGELLALYRQQLYEWSLKTR